MNKFLKRDKRIRSELDDCIQKELETSRSKRETDAKLTEDERAAQALRVTAGFAFMVVKDDAFAKIAPTGSI